MVAYSAMEDLRNGRLAPWVQRYKWAIYFFVSVAFWNMVGAGLFGFMINPPIALYYMQGLNTTPLHGHAALFGVYGMLGIGLMLVCLRALEPRLEWKEGWLRFAFWGMNAGLFFMCVGSLLPVGLAQTWASVDKGYWYARSTEFLSLPYMQTLRWLRVPGDTLVRHRRAGPGRIRFRGTFGRRFTLRSGAPRRDPRSVGRLACAPWIRPPRWTILRLV